MMRSIIVLSLALLLVACKHEKEYSGNPIVEGWYADPEGVVFDDEYWIYPTLSDIPFGADSADFPGLQKKRGPFIRSIIYRLIWMLFHQKIWSTGLSIPKCCLLRI